MNAQVKNASSKEEYQPEDFLHLNVFIQVGLLEYKE